ncbi:hypothetical protein KL86DES1_21143 [uncultured Desulfovibrio sp.]|uniref:Uncharacterized protein n=1 Tax=uncultured Desulfovibrio sp. TaxID=167968 RepID=A0A212L6V4_9BACT|nr:hypothetical protein KL86DES1_21143 [uncultured Desulfovibrio sp.]VZH34040.1 conserved protein of unknown function [Desulfovibrio sp. 86]
MATVLLEHAVQYTREAQIKEPLGNALVFRLARRDLFLKQEWTLSSSTVSKKVKQVRQTEYISVSLGKKNTGCYYE